MQTVCRTKVGRTKNLVGGEMSVLLYLHDDKGVVSVRALRTMASTHTTHEQVQKMLVTNFVL